MQQKRKNNINKFRKKAIKHAKQMQLLEVCCFFSFFCSRIFSVFFFIFLLLKLWPEALLEMREIYEKNASSEKLLYLFFAFLLPHFFCTFILWSHFFAFSFAFIFLLKLWISYNSSLPHIPPKRFPFSIPTLGALKWTPQKHLPFVVSYLKPCQLQVVHGPPTGQVLFPPGSIFRVLGFYPCNSQSLRCHTVEGLKSRMGRSRKGRTW